MARRRTVGPGPSATCPCRWSLLGSLGLVLAIAASHLIPTDTIGRLIGGVMVVLFGFLFVTVSSRITGVIGSSSNPISGMTIATLLLTCLIFVLLGWVGPEYRLTALSIAGVVCIASSNGGTTSQDLKTGFLVGATPWKQQVAILVGALVSAIVMGGTLLWLNDAYTTVTDRPADLPSVKADVSKLKGTEVGTDGKTYRVWWVVNPEPGVLPGKYLVDETGQARFLNDPGIGGRLNYADFGSRIKKFNPPQPRLFATMIDGIMKGDLPWGLVDPGRGAGRRDATCRRVGPGVCGGRLPAAVDHSADLRRRPAPRRWSTGCGGSRRGGRDEPRHHDVHRPDRRRLAGRHHHRPACRLRELRQEDRFLGQVRPAARPSTYLPAIGAFGVIAAALLAVALAGKRPVAEETKADTIGGEI